MRMLIGSIIVVLSVILVVTRSGDMREKRELRQGVAAD